MFFKLVNAFTAMIKHLTNGLNSTELPSPILDFIPHQVQIWIISIFTMWGKKHMWVDVHKRIPHWKKKLFGIVPQPFIYPAGVTISWETLNNPILIHNVLSQSLETCCLVIFQKRLLSLQWFSDQKLVIDSWEVRTHNK